MSPNQIIPQQPYTLGYYITDHTDNNTYYVRAVVYDAATGEVLDTQNLTRQTTNTHLYSKVAQAPGDPSNRGRRIIVVATAYEDSGYTTKSGLYQEQSENYIIAKGASTQGGGGWGIDYRVVREIFIEELAKLPKFKKTDLSKIDFGPVIEAIGSIDIPEPTDLAPLIEKIPKATDLKPVMKMMGEVQQVLAEKIDAIDIPEEVDLSPVMEALAKVEGTVEAKADFIKEVMSEARIRENGRLMDKVSQLKTLLGDPEVQALLNYTKPKPPVEDKPAHVIDINDLITKKI